MQLYFIYIARSTYSHLFSICRPFTKFEFESQYILTLISDNYFALLFKLDSREFELDTADQSVNHE